MIIKAEEKRSKRSILSFARGLHCSWLSSISRKFPRMNRAIREDSACSPDSSRDKGRIRDEVPGTERSSAEKERERERLWSCWRAYALLGHPVQKFANWQEGRRGCGRRGPRRKGGEWQKERKGKRGKEKRKKKKREKKSFAGSSVKRRETKVEKESVSHMDLSSNVVRK